MNANSNSIIQQQLNMGPDVGRYPPSENPKNENRAPLPLPPTLNSMLKTTTERGDVGQFAIKPPRVPQTLRPPRTTAATYNESPSQHPQQNFHYAPRKPVVDDRKQLPSYSRDATSEIVSMYETASQKSPKRPQFQLGPENRSYSMTQASYLPHLLSNHRSYTSLRSQPDLTLVQRPRSPFPYPARLKRLGFRPTSPVLTGGRTTDFNLRADIQRTLNGYGGTRSVSPSVCANKRVPAALRRSNATRSNPSLLGQSPTSQRSSLSPQHSSIGSIQEWNNRTEKTSRKASPARSMLSTDFATNILQPRTSPSTSTLLANHALLPLFYDYTEEFNNEEAQAPRETESARERVPPPPFLVEKTIHEDRKLSSESFHPDSIFTRGLAVKMEPGYDSRSSKEDIQNPLDKLRAENEDQMERTTNVTQDIIPLYLDRLSCDRILPTVSNNTVLSNSNIPTSIVDEASSEPSQGTILQIHINSTIQKMENVPEDFQPVEDCDLGDHKTGSLFGKRSSFRLSTLLPNFPSPPNRSVRVNRGVITTAHDQQAQNDQTDVYSRDLERQEYAVHETSPPGAQPLSLNEHVSLSSGQAQRDAAEVISQSLPSPQRNHTRSTRFKSIDHGLTDLPELITNFKAKNGSSQSRVILSESPTLQDIPPLSVIGRRQSSLFMDSRMALNKFRSEGDLRALKLRAERLVPHLYPEEQVTNSKAREKADWLPGPVIDERQLAKESFLRPGPPMLAPQPMSPARALRLKNSIPQLMKALPPVPRDFTYTLLHQGQSSSTGASLLSLEIDSKPAEQSRPQNIGLVPPFVPPAPQDQASNQVAQSCPTPLPSLRFKLKSRSFTKNRYPSPPSSRPWNLEESYHWAGQKSDVCLPFVTSKPLGIQRPSSFKLRASETFDEASGTVKFNPDAKECRAMSSLDLRHPKDLFTSSSNLSDVFRQVSRHFSSANTNTSVEAASPELYLASPLPTYPMSPTEVQSFFSDNSSQGQSHNGLRKRISNLRARFPHPYLLRSVGQINGNENAIQLSSRPTLNHRTSGLNEGSRQDVDEYGMPLTKSRHRGFKGTVSGWFTGARLAMGWHGKTHGDNEGWCLTIRR